MMYGAGVFDLSQAGFTAENMGAIATRAGGVGFTSGYISSGGDLGEAFKSGMFSALGAAVAFNIGHVIPWSGSENAIMAKMALAHGVSQGAISEMRGGNFKSGFIGGFLGKISGGLAETMFDDKVAQYIAVTMIGGAVSEAAGGDFLEGAVAAAMVHLFNDGAGSRGKLEEVKKLLANAKDGHLTLEEANAWYLYMHGKSIIVDGDQLSYTQTGSINDAGKYTAVINGANDYAVHGQITVNSINGHIYDGIYDFEMHSWTNPINWIRNFGALLGISIAGNGVPYEIQYRYNNEWENQ